MRRLMMTVLLVVALPLAAQVTDLHITKSGSDVVLTWATGTGPFIVIRADMPQMTTRTITLIGTASPITDSGARTDGARLHCYVINDSSTAPAVAIATPAASFTSAAPCICATGTASAGALFTYCNTMATTGTPQAWTACQNGYGVPLAVAADPHTGNAVTVTAACVDANTNWAYVVVSGSYTGTITARVTCVPRGLGM